mgnify:CR=1 FL=1
MDVSVVILAAGKGSRMKSSIPKVLHPLAGRPLVQHVIDTARQLSSEITLVIGHGADMVEAKFGNQPVTLAVQGEQLGTGHAVAQALPHVRRDGVALVLYGDVPLTRAETLRQLTNLAGEKTLALLTVTMEDPTGYGRIVRNESGDIQAIVEQKDANSNEKAIREVNSGIMAMPAWVLHDWLPRLSNDNAQGEYYLTDLVAMAVTEGVSIRAAHPAAIEETLGVNNRVQLAELERFFQRHQVEQLMLAGVTLRDPARVDIRGELTVGADSDIDINVVFEGRVDIGERVTIGPNVILRDVKVGDDVRIEANTLIEGASVGAGASVGPFARIRPGTELAERAKVGNFVETKKAIIGIGSKVNHLSYIGDAVIGEGANIGAGTITCNYDGVNKFVTEIGSGAFVGSNSTLVAPVVIEAGAFVGAGSVLTKTAPAEQLTVGRARQVTVPNWKRPAKK